MPPTEDIHVSDLYEINSASGRYRIEVGDNLIEKAFRLYPQAIYIIDQNLLGRIPQSVTKRIIIEATEENKALEQAAEYVSGLRKLNATRDTHIVAIGGGIIQDITTFIASIYMRGLSWTYLPTTVLSMADSCIGGKSSINVAGYKNLIGNFYPPKDIYIDPSFIKTLDADMIVGGLFEAAKICYAKDAATFAAYTHLQPSQDASSEQMTAIIGLALSTKKWFIEIDEFDQKERLLLNFGHTFGHAIEASTNFGVHHGIGVGAGMLIAAIYAEQKNFLSADGKCAVGELKSHILNMLLQDTGSSIGAPDRVSIASTLEKFDYDKKHKELYYRIVIPKNDGALELISLERTPQTRDALKQAYLTGFEALGWSYQ